MLTFHNIHLGVLVWRLEDPRDVRSLRLLDLNRAAEGDLTNKFVLDHRMRQGKKLASPAPSVFRFWKGTP
jgi:hypothetical protein